MATKSQSAYRVESASEFKRRRGAELIQQGEDLNVIARVLGVTTRTLFTWRAIIRNHGSLKFRPRVGRRRKLSSEQIDSLRELLSKGAMVHGWPNALWTTERVAALIRTHFNVIYSIGSAYRVMRDYLGWTVQRPVRRCASRDEELIRHWRETELPRILAEIRQRRAHLVLLDESGFMLNSSICRTFSPRGHRPVIKVTEPHARISAIGAISISPVRRHLRVFSHLLPDNANFRADSVLRFVADVSCRLPGPLIFVCDACPIHCTNSMHEFLRKNPRVEIEELPPCAPELNPVDKMWGYLKHHRLANYTPHSLDELRRRLTVELKALTHKQNVLAWCVRQAGLGGALD